MRILFLTPEVPYPPDSGGRLKTQTVLEYLHKDHGLTVLSFRRRPLDAEQLRWAASLPRVRTLPLNRGRDPVTLARSYASGVPLSIERNRHPAMAAMVDEEMGRVPFEAVLVDHWLMAQYVPDGFKGIRILHEHNAEYVIWRRQAARSRNPLLKREAARVRKYEEGMLARFDRVFAVSESDRRALIELGAREDQVSVLPNIPDPALLDAPALVFAESEPAILYFGTLSWQPNIDGLERFLRGIFPRVRERCPDARFLIAGKDAPRGLVGLARRTPGVECLGQVDIGEPLYRRGRAFVEATRTGGGTKLKVLNALARGLPVVASPEAAEGLEVTDGEDILIARDDSSMTDAIVRILGNERLWQHLSDAGRRLVRKKYVADVAFSVLDETLRGVPARR